MTSPASARLLATPLSQQRRPNAVKDELVKKSSCVTTPRAQIKSSVNSTFAQSKLNKENGVNQSTLTIVSSHSARLTKSPVVSKLNAPQSENASVNIRSPLATRNANTSVNAPSSITQPVKRAIVPSKTNAVAGVRKLQPRPQPKPQSKPFAAQSALQKEVVTLSSALQMEKEKNAALRVEIERLRSELTRAKSNQIVTVEDDEFLKDFWHPVAPWDYYDAVNSHASSASESEAEEVVQTAEKENVDDDENCDDSAVDDYVSDDDNFADDEVLTDDEFSENDDERFVPSVPMRTAPTLAASEPTVSPAHSAADDLDEFSNIAHRLSQLRVTPARTQHQESGVIDISSSPDSAYAVHSRHLSVNPLLLSPVNVSQMFNDNDQLSDSDVTHRSSIDVSQVRIDSASSSPMHESSYSQAKHLITPLSTRSESFMHSPSQMTQSESETDTSDEESVEDDETVSNMSAEDQVSVDSATEDEEEVEEEDDGSSQGFVDTFPYERNLYLLSRHYHLHNRLYSCTDAVTFKATHIQTGQLVVIKISEGYSHSGYLSGSRASHPKEVRLLSSAQGHGNIMEMTGWFGFPATRCYAFITRYIENVSVENLFDNASLIRLYMRDLLTGIAHLHSRNILYRDLKPSNVLWNNTTEKATIIDFDVATFFNREGGHASHVGTFGYMAPEMDGQTRYTLAVDVYAAGIVFGSLLFGFHEDEVADRERADTKGAAMIDRVLAFSQQFNGRIGADFHLLLRMLTEDPTLRINVEDALLHPYITQRG